MSAMEEFAAVLGFGDYRSLHRWSVDNLDEFWVRATEFAGVEWDAQPSSALRSTTMPTTAWFDGGRLNYAEHVLRGKGAGDDDLAVIERSHTRDRRELSRRQLRDEVAKCAAGLEASGVSAGDRVAAYMPNITETLVAFLATAQIGATWSSCAPEFGVKAVVDRFSQFAPTVLFTVDGYRYGSRDIDRTDDVAEILAGLPTVKLHVPVRYLGKGDDAWSRLLSHGSRHHFHQAAYDTPLYVLYSSGTTGLPKAIVHSHVGVLAEHLVVHSLHHDMSGRDRFFWFTTTGWMMWNYLVTGLATGASIVLFDGDPAADGLRELWSLAEDEGVTVFGASAGFLDACRKADLHPVRASIRQVGSTGSPLAAEAHEWINAVLGDDVPVNSISGGTDVCSAFLGWNPMLPSVPGRIAGPILGRDVAAFDEDGTRCPVGVRGELVVTTPMPSMPLGFLDDPDGSRFGRSYFGRFAGVWCHGDWITFAEDGSCVISGRSDATLNRGGVRLGTADFYEVVESFDQVADSLVVHLDSPGEDQLILFVQMRDGAEWDDDLKSRVSAALRSQLSPRHVPDESHSVPRIPRTLSGKKLEVPVKRILAGESAEKVASRDSLADPASLDWFVSSAQGRCIG